MDETSESKTLQSGSEEAIESYTSSESPPYLEPLPINLGETAVSASDVSEFPSPGSKLLDENGVPEAMQYPGKRPNQSFSLSGSQVTLGEFFAHAPNNSRNDTAEAPAFYVNVRQSDGKELVWNVNDLLRTSEAATMEERYPVIAFGSNANPGQLAQKFTELEGADKTIVPTLTARVKGLAPVYVARIGINGYTFTDLSPTKDPEASCEVCINFLSKAQLAAMNETEKAYRLCEIPGVTIDTADGKGYQTPAYLYVGRSDAQGANILTDENGRAIRLAELDAQGEGIDQEFAVMTQPEVQEYIFNIAGDRIAENLMLDQKPTDNIEIIKIIVDRNRDPRLQPLKQRIKEDTPEGEKSEPLGRVTGRAVQQAIEASGHTAPSRNVRPRIPAEKQDLEIDTLKTFGQLAA